MGPTGGVINPIPKLSIIIIPKCMGSTPTTITIGKKIGVVIKILADISIIIPRNNRTMLIINKTTTLSVENPNIPLATIFGILK